MGLRGFRWWLTLSVASLAVLPATAAARGRQTRQRRAATWRLVQRVVTATDRPALVALRQRSDFGQRYVTYSDRRSRITVTIIGREIQYGNVRGIGFTRSGRGCYTTMPQPFIGLADVALTLIPEPQAGPPDVPHVGVSYQLRGRQIEWSMAQPGQSRFEHGVITFDSRDRIIRSSSAEHTDLISYPRTLPRDAPRSLPHDVCRARLGHARRWRMQS